MHTLRDIKNRGVVRSTKVNISPGHRLDSICELELEKALRGSIQSTCNIANDYKVLQDIYLERMNDHVQAQANASKKISQLNATNIRLKSSK